MAAGVIVGKLAVVKETGKALVLDIGGHQVAAFGSWLQSKARELEHQNVIAAVEVSAKQGNNRLFTSLRMVSLAKAQDGYETSTVAGTGVVEAVRQFGKSYEVVLQNGEGRLVLSSKEEPVIGQTVGFRGFFRVNKGFTNVVATELTPVGGGNGIPDELPF